MTTTQTTHAKHIRGGFLALALIATLIGPAQAADSGSSRPSYSQPAVQQQQSGMGLARQAIKTEQYELAVSLLKAELQKHPNDADVNNLLGYSNRKLKKYDLALTYYKKALEINPQHRGANNYLAHLYLETDQLVKAEERLAILDKACRFGCEEYSELKQAIKNYRGPIASNSY